MPGPHLNPSRPSSNLKAGAIQAETTPPVSIGTTGYVLRAVPSTGARDPLFTCAPYPEQGVNQALLLTCELLGAVTTTELLGISSPERYTG